MSIYPEVKSKSESFVPKTERLAPLKMIDCKFPWPMTELLSIDVKNFMFGLLVSSITGEQEPSEFMFSKVNEGKPIKPHKVQEFLFPLRLQVLQDEWQYLVI